MGYLEYSESDEASHWSDRDKFITGGQTTQGYGVTVWSLKTKHYCCGNSACNEASSYSLYLKTHSTIHEYLYCKTHVNAYLEGHGVKGRVS